MIAHYLGARANAILHLTWDDVRRSETDAVIVWESRWDKTGREREQPIPSQVEFALGVAWGWRVTDNYSGPWIFYTSRRSWKGDQPITYGGMNWMLRQAEQRAGAAHVHGNAMHRFRRGAAGNVLDLTGGDIQRAMAWIGDEDLAMARRYLKHRDERLQQVAALLSADPGTATEQQSASRRSRETTS